MTNRLQHKNFQSLIQALVLSTLLAVSLLPASVNAATVDLATVPLPTATTTSVLPNLMFILDNSGSMGQDYTPDYMSDYNSGVANNKVSWTESGASTSGVCRDNADDNDSVTFGVTALKLCVVGDVPYMTSTMNTQYYNPAIRYLPGVSYDGVSKPSQTSPTAVLTDAYNKQNKTQLNVSTTTANLTISYPDRVWCTKNNPTAAELVNTTVCRKNSDYSYPDATYKYGRTSSGSSSNVLGVYDAPYYYDVVPTEYCTEADLKDCTLSSVATGTYIYAAKSRWCSNTSLTTCQAVKTSTYKYPRYVGASATAVAASGYATVGGTSKNKCFSSIKVNGVEILGATSPGICWGNTENDAGFATALKNQINTYNSNPEYTATINAGNTSRIDIISTLAAGATANGDITYISTGTTLTMQSGTDIKGGVTGASLPPYTFARTDIISSTTSYPKTTSRTDCTGATCTYDQEITNFANWYAYYRTRMQSMKSAASLAFKPIDSRYRVGFINITTDNYLPIDKFDAGSGGQKDKWYTKLFGTNPSSTTPLRTALSTVGRIYAGKKPVGSSDPVQYSCQQNFALLTTDGYWNDSDSGAKKINGTAMTNMDGGSTPRPMYEGPTASANSLADVAKYYYDTDLRDSDLSVTGFNSCQGALGVDVCENNVFVSGTDNNVKQHMTTFTLGLGVNGTLLYTNDYKSIKKDDTSASPPKIFPAPTGAGKDYYNLINGYGTPVVNWSEPDSGTETTVDDLWHAAVNGQGTYFSAKDPTQLTQGLSDALSQINAKVGAGAAAATSTLNPVAGNNFAYVASYTTVKWTGNLEARTINLTTGAVSDAATWCVEDVVTTSCPSPSSIVGQTSGSSTSYYCVTPSATSCDSPSIWDGTSCKVEVPKACTGTLRTTVNSGTRSIKMNVSGTLADFTYTNLSTAGLNGNFESDFLEDNLSQWTSLDPATQQTIAKEANLVNYLRGEKGFEDSDSNAAVNRVFRYRESVMGDALESAPVFVGQPNFNYLETSYSGFKSISRTDTVYLGTNDGMLHAFNAADGTERWAYIPSMVIPNMWKLADKNYATMHTNYVNGTTTVSDVCTSTCASSSDWKTILVGGLNGGGKGYYALNVTGDTPSLLWEFDTSRDNDMGYSFGNPVVTKLKPDGSYPLGRWVVVLTSGYNNTTGSNPGKGFLYVLDANTGAVLRKISTGEGSATTPSGLAKITAFIEAPSKNNEAVYVYGGDLLGNLWRFDINVAGATGSNPFLLTTLKDDNGTAQPITTRPELGKIGGERVVFVGTGKYLEVSDLTDTQQQTIYAIKDTGASLDNARTHLTGQLLSTSGATRTAPNSTENYFTSGNGWYVDLPDSGERQNVAGRLVSGTLVVPTTVPSNAVCSPGGYGWVNYFNYKNGGGNGTTGTGIVSSKTNAPPVGINIVYIDGNPVGSVTTADEATPKLVSIEFGSNPLGFGQKRAIWRELID
ncbi:MAG: PilC/PilY family type IV pilus protein [Methylotenera sp.]|nr:PilC/PilY family type IV pilus protein [Methylotenera sp.]